MVTESWGLATEKWHPSKRFQAACDSQHTGGWEGYLPSRKERHPERVWFQASILQELFHLKDVELPGLLQRPKFQSGSCDSLHFPRLANTFLGHYSTAQEEAGCRSVSESVGCHCVVTAWMWHFLQMCPRCGVVICLLASELTKGWRKDSSVRSKKSATGCIFKQLLGHTVLGPPETKMQILPLRYSIQIDTQFVSLQDPWMFQTDLIRSLLQRKVMELTFGCCFDYPYECGTPTTVHSLRGHCSWKITSKQVFQAVCDSQHAGH